MIGTALPAVTYGYDPTSGLPTTQTAGSQVLSTGYDTLGRATSYTDAGGNTATTTYDIDGRQQTSYDGIATTSYQYDGPDEHRGLLTRLDTGISSAPAGQPGVFTGGYDEAGNLTVQTYPIGLEATTTYDNTGADTALTYAKDGVTWAAFTQTPGATGQTAAASSPASKQTYSYDNAGRLTTVADAVTAGPTAAACTTRVYGFDADSNRTTLKTHPGDATKPDEPTCTTTTTPTTVTRTYDAADRLTDSGYTYDTLGRTLTLPAVDAQGIGEHAATTGPAGLDYYTNDMIHGQTQGGATRTYTLDPAQNRIATATDGTITTSHYDSDGDAPAWVSRSDGATTRYVSGIDGRLVGSVDGTGIATLQLCNLHGDIVATVADDGTAAG